MTIHHQHTEKIEEFKLPSQRCSFLDRDNCIICGKWYGWYGKEPTPERWRTECKRMQEEHDAKRQKQFESLTIEEQE